MDFTEHSGLALSRIRSRLLVTLQGDLSPEVHERLLKLWAKKLLVAPEQAVRMCASF